MQRGRAVTVVVIGGGVVGLCAAVSAADRGLPVVLLERDALGSGASHGNAGWVFPSHSQPLPAPGGRGIPPRPSS